MLSAPCFSQSGLQAGLFEEDAPPPQVATTAIYPNRVSDKAKVERLLALPEFPGSTPVVFKTPKDSVFAHGYNRIVYGDHGPYVEFRRSDICCALKQKFGRRALPADAYYEWLEPCDGSGIKVYDQKRDVKGVKNAPAGGFSGNRAEGYADYVPGMIYVSPWELVIERDPL